MGFCLFIKPFRSLKRRLQIKGDLKRHCFASFVRSSSSSGARVDRRSLYFLDKESSLLFTTSLHQHEKSISYGQDYNGQPDDSSLGSDENENDEIYDEREDIEALSQNAVQDALSTVAEEYLEDFAITIVEYTLKKISVENDDGTTSGQKERTILQEDRDIEMLNTNKQFECDGVPSKKPHSPQDDRSPPTDYTMLCVPKDYSIFGNKVVDLTKEDREAMLSKRGVWPGEEAIEYQFEFVAMIKSIEAENERSEREVGDHKVAGSRMACVDVGDSVEGDDESSDDDDDGLTITFEVGPSKINRHPDQPHSDSSEGDPSDCTLSEEDKSPPSPCLSPTQSGTWTDTPTCSSPPVSTSPPPYWRRTPPPSPPPSRFVHHHGHPSPRHPMMGSSQEAWHDNHQMRMPRMKGTVGAKEWEEGVRYVPKTDYRRQGRDRRHYESPPHCRAPPYQGRSNYRNGQRFGPRCDSRQISNHHEDRDYLTAVGQPTYPEHARYQHPPRPRPVPFPYHPNSQSAYYDHRARPQSCRQAAARWDGPVHQSHPFRQEWGGPSPQFGYSYHPHHHHHHHHHHFHHRDYDHNNFNRRQR